MNTTVAARCLLASRGVPLSVQALAGAMIEAEHYELVRGFLEGLSSPSDGRKTLIKFG